MSAFVAGSHLQAIVVGDSDDEFVIYATTLLDDEGIAFSCCDDVYSTVAELAKDTNKNVLIIGRLSELNKEQGRFFHIAGEKGCHCCYLAEANSTRRQQLPVVVETGASIINRPAELKNVVTELLANGWICSTEKKQKKGASAFNKNDFLTTKAELDALLEFR
ncbi:MAG: hypothetical protein ACYSYU_11065 [Planctomycetota bacterium]|jgi:hypothetical protein